jgi:tetratricopeptide (TPR) repeat protein
MQENGESPVSKGRIMPSDRDESPSQPEIASQLAHLLRSRTLRSAPTQSRLLEFVVNCALQGREIREADILPLLVSKDHPNPEPSNARATATNLRKTLRKYYEEIDEEAPIIIALPPGRAYRPEFSYNPCSAAYKAYRRGVSHMNRFLSADDARLALEYLHEAIRLQPAYALAYAAKADAEFREAIYRADAPPGTWITAARTTAEEALLLNPKSWRAHVVMGAIHCSAFQWAKARAAFDAALSIAALETTEHFYYFAFLAATGQAEEALKLAHARWERHREDPFAGLATAMLAYIVRDAEFYAAYSHTWAVVRENRSLWVGDAILCCVTLGVADVAGGLLATEASGHIDQAHRLLGMDVFPGLAILSDSPRWLMDQSIGNIRARTATLHPRIGNLEIRSKESYVPPMQLALAHMAVDEMDEAVSQLVRACEQRDPKTAWLHICPLFDALRDRVDFQSLLMRYSLSPRPTD